MANGYELVAQNWPLMADNFYNEYGGQVPPTNLPFMEWGDFEEATLPPGVSVDSSEVAIKLDIKAKNIDYSHKIPYWPAGWHLNEPLPLGT